MIDICQHAVKTGEKKADEIEAVYTKRVYMGAEAELGTISKASKTHNEQVRIRVIKDKALGSSVTYRLDKESVDIAVKKALAAARVSEKDENWTSLPYSGEYPRLNIWDSSVVNVGSDQLMGPISEMLQAAPSDVKVSRVFNGVEILEEACCTSNGISHEDKGALARSGMGAAGILETGVTPGFSKFKYARKYDPDPQEIAQSVISKINLFKNVDSASSGTFQIILAPQNLQLLFFFTLSKALSGENAARGKSLLAGKKGEKIADSQFTFRDNGVIPEGVSSKEMDDEGVRRQNTLMVEDGILKGFLWNDYWAKRTGNTSTGNAYYDDKGNEMGIQQTNMVIEPGDFSKEELFDIKDGYYVLGFQGVHGSNPESGDFSVVCNPAFRIRNGTISGGVTGMMMSDNIFSLLKNIDAVGKDTDVVYYGILPHIRFADINVAAK